MTVHPTRVELAGTAWVAPNATLTGQVRLGEASSVWFGCVLRGDLEPITVGDETNIQDLSVIHVDRGFPTIIGSGVTIGHRSVIHGCSIDDEAVIGMGAIVLSGSKVGRGALVAAGAVVREGFEVPPGAIAAGVPAVVRGKVDAALAKRFADGREQYVRLAALQRGGA